ncbi:O-methyltransferase [Methanosarcina siciliae T4/M]|uniref:O-methyltransferase n=2 Tax=Methanosarcina siciliae TaxID=38027 RepID=A0A0E3LA26_9EURY|nr:O-methyltransferase [Methanosarcina siciliae]AKB27346.1 O-methyltransferase [Methanosarcina siciliae T4/M]AKB31286.1 O-methyltransferase [Methanosarcina siciliae HI350]
MFHDIFDPIKERMNYLEFIDKNDRINGTPKLHRLRQIPPETGKFIALMLSASPDGVATEIGTSAGYSSMWLALACIETKRKLITFEIQEEKVKMARETFSKAGIENIVELVHGDARHLISRYTGISFCFLDCDKEYYLDCYEAVIPKMIRGGILIADNVISHAAMLKPFLDCVYNDQRVDAVLVPLKNGELVCRKR